MKLPADQAVALVVRASASEALQPAAAGSRERWRLPAGALRSAALVLLTAALTAAALHQPAGPSGAGPAAHPPGEPWWRRQPACTPSQLHGELNASSVFWEGQGTVSLGAGGGLRAGWSPGAPPPRLQMVGCALRRFTAAEARACLAGRPLLFLGDSITRCECWAPLLCLLPGPPGFQPLSLACPPARPPTC